MTNYLTTKAEEVRITKLGPDSLVLSFSNDVRDYIPFFVGEEKGKEGWLRAFEKQTNQQVFKEFDAMASIQWVVHQGTIRL